MLPACLVERSCLSLRAIVAALGVVCLSLLIACGGSTDDSVPKAASVSQETQQAPCIDSDKIDPTLMCTMDYTPVCGCDGKTYSNSCAATSAGVTRWTEGECEVAE